MDSTEFAMVEELAFLVKENLPCKHLVLSKEEAFVNFLQDDASSNGVLELEPMNSYYRLILHRLADIFGFSHHSVGEGEDRHLILERCPETSIPSILVRDLLWQYGEVQSPEKFDKLPRKQGGSDGLQVENLETLTYKFSPEEREAAYLAAHEWIFFYMSVEELAFLIKDNLPCKHLVLSMEEAIVNFLQDDTSSNGVLELEPMNSYNRFLLHHLADIFGLSHHSVGEEGEDRHLILERCPETSIPSILVRDLLWRNGEVHSPEKFDILPRKQEGSQVENLETLTTKSSLEEREAAYLAARERIFSMDGNGTEHMNQRPKKDLKVARRMIEHALGQRIRPSTNEVKLEETKEEEGTNPNKQTHLKGCKPEGPSSNEEKLEDTEQSGGQTEEEGGTNPNKQTHLEGCKPEGSEFNSSKSPDTEMKTPMNDAVGSSGQKNNEGKIPKENLREQHMGAAKRMFANALGFPREGSLSKVN